MKAFCKIRDIHLLICRKLYKIKINYALLEKIQNGDVALKTRKSRIIKTTITVVLGVSICLFLCLFLPKIISQNSVDTEQLNSECNITSTLKTLTKNVGDKFNLVNAYGVKIEASDNCYNPVFACDNVNLASVDFATSDVECLQEGKVTLYVKVTAKNSTEPVKRGFTLNIQKEKTYPTIVKFEHQSVTLSNENPTYTNALVLSETTEEPEISYQKNLVEYDWQNGVVKLKDNVTITQNMTDKVTLKIPKSATEYFEVSFNVNIVSNEIIINLNDETITKNSTAIIRYSSALESYDSLSSFNIISIENDSIAKVEDIDLGYLIIKGLQNGSTKLTISNGHKTICVNIIVE